MSNSSSHHIQVQRLVYNRSSINHHWIKLMPLVKFCVNSYANFKWWIKLTWKLQVHWFQSKNKARQVKREKEVFTHIIMDSWRTVHLLLKYPNINWENIFFSIPFELIFFFFCIPKLNRNMWNGHLHWIWEPRQSHTFLKGRETVSAKLNSGVF